MSIVTYEWEKFMKKLAYGILSLLSTNPLTGYDLNLKLNLFWQTTHSAIYPLLHSLEQEGYVRYVLIPQNGKPDKKQYNITESGKEILKDWLLSSSKSMVVKDEILLKFYCIHILDKKTAMNMFHEIEEKYVAKRDEYLKTFSEIKSQWDGKKESIHSPNLGVYFILQKRIEEYRLGIQWCRWIKALYEDHNSNFYDMNFEKFIKINNDSGTIF